jgi:hypothetical protein
VSLKPITRRDILRAAAGLALPAPAAAARKIIPGAIRWDAWYAATGPAREAQNALGFPPWQSRAPWFAKIDGPDHLTAIGTQPDIDRECAFAAAAGLRYWAFVMFPPASEMSAAWRLYQSSPNRRLVDWCAIVGPGFLGNDPFARTDLWHARDETLLSWFGQPSYQTLAGRPLIYVLWSEGEIATCFAGQRRNFAASLSYLRARCRALRIGNPYVVIMAGTAANSALISRAVGADAISSYIPDIGPAPRGAVPWAVLDQRTRLFWASLAGQGVDCIPIATTGWDTRARRAHPESWDHETDTNPRDYFVLPTPAQLRAHLRAAGAFIAAHPAACPSRALLIYSWDECDEGGNPLIPTLAHPPGQSLLDSIAPEL